MGFAAERATRLPAMSIGQQAELCRDLWIYWACQGPATDVRRVVAALVEGLPEPGPARGTLLWISALFSSQGGNQAAAAALATEALEIGRATRNAEIVVCALEALAVAAWLDRRWDDTMDL